MRKLNPRFKEGQVIEFNPTTRTNFNKDRIEWTVSSVSPIAQSYVLGRIHDGKPFI